jgi:hypothetical protein
MANISQGQRTGSGPYKYMGGSVSLGYDRLLKSTSGGFRNFHAGEATVIGSASISNKAGFPNGATHPYSWSLGIKAGGLSSYNSSNIAFSATADLLSVKTMDGSSSISFTSAGDLGLVISLDGTSSITFTSTADLDGIAQITGSSSIVFSSAADLGTLTALAGTSTITFSSDANLTGIARLDGTSGGAPELSPEGLAAAVWSAVAGDYNAAGTMGEKLNDAGSAANPWTEVIESGYTAEEILRILLAVAAGKTTISGSDVAFRDVADTKDRVAASMTGSERTTVTLDGA